MPKVEESLYNTFVSCAPKVIELEQKPEEDNIAPPFNEKDVVPIKGKGIGRKVLAHAYFQASTHSYTKASVQLTTAPTTTMVGSPTATSSIPLPILLMPLLIAAQPSHRCLARGRFLHRIYLRLPRRGDSLSLI
jgi:hypothetical protein